MRKSALEREARSSAMTEGVDAGQLALELRALLSDAEALLRASTGADAAQLHERAESSVRELRARLSSLEEQLRERGQAVDAYVRANPWQAVAVAGGAALLLGLLLARR
jgi:ElaB/YqjD/DUF883 family membrane-anchored ribosome-binding protein